MFEDTGEDVKSLFMPFSLSHTVMVFICIDTVIVHMATMPESIHESMRAYTYLCNSGSEFMSRPYCSNIGAIVESSSLRKKKIYITKMINGTISVKNTRMRLFTNTRRWRLVRLHNCSR